LTRSIGAGDVDANAEQRRDKRPFDAQ